MVVRWFPKSTRWMAVAFLAGVSQLVGQAHGQLPAPGRVLAADAVVTIPPGGEYGDTFEGPIDLPLVTPPADLAWGPPNFPENRPNYAPLSETLLGMSKSIVLRHEIWSMELRFKPVRMISVSMRNAQGDVEPKVVWYLVYSVRYKGNDLQPQPSPDASGNEVFEAPVRTPGRVSRRFIPAFVLNATALGKPNQHALIP